MRPFTPRVFAFFIAVFAALPLTAQTIRPTGRAVPNEVVVKIRNAASANDVAALERLADAQDSKRLAKLTSGTLIRMKSRSKNADAVATALQHNPNVEYVEPNFVIRLVATPNDPSFNTLWGLRNTGQTISGIPGNAGADIDAPEAWNVTTGSASVVVGVIDTGIDYNHPDLAANIWSNPGGKGNPDCAAGTHGFNAITGTCDPMDDNDHGTHVAGTIGAAGNNGVGVTGVNWTTSIMGLKFLDWTGSGTIADAIAAIDFAVQAKIDGVNIRVLSNSWGGGPFSKALLDEINKANEHDILFVAAAGNDATNNDVFPHYPSNYSTPNMISVAATDNRDGLAWFTNLGATTVHLAAPGVDIRSTIAGGGYAYFNGTSMATPHVSGVAALLLAKTPSLTTAQVKNAILTSVDPLGILNGRCITGGRLNAAKALGVAGTPDFTISISPTSRMVARGGSTAYTVTVTPANGFAGSVDLIATNLQTGHTVSFLPATTTSTSTLVLAAGGTSPLNTHTFSVTASSGLMTRTAFATVSTSSSQPPSLCPSFTAGSIYDAYTPTAVTTGDFNRDGNADLATVETSGNRVQIRLGPSFPSSFAYAVGNTPLFVVGGDFNRDGKADLATANSGSHNVSVLLGNGDGTFQGAVHYGAGTSPFALTAADLDSDGDLDLAVANNGASSVSILAGAGNGTFGTASHYAAGSGPYWVTAADVDRDGRPDLAVANYNAGTISLLRGNGNGTFQAPLDATAGSKPSAVVAGDFDRDGNLDLGVSNYDSNNVSLLAGNGNGTFDAAVNFAAGTNPNSVAASDFNGDGRLDLLTANGGSNNLSILLSSGNGTFQAPIALPLSRPSYATAADVNNDGKPDVVATSLEANWTAVIRNLSGCSVNCGTINPADTIAYGSGNTAESVATGDVNGDGKADIITVHSGDSAVTISLGNGDGTMSTPAVAINAGAAPHGVVTGDFNADGKLDLAISRPGANVIAVLLGNGDGAFQPAVEYASGDGPRSMAAGDFDRDGKLDLAVATRGSDTVTILRGFGDGSFFPPVSHGAGVDPEAVATGDFNRDGRVDLAVANRGASNLSILLGNGDATFQTATSVNVDVSPYAVIAHDLNHDGKLDLVAGNSGSDKVSVLIGNGDGTFKAAVHYIAQSFVHGVAAADFNADGRVDLAVTNFGTDKVSFFFAIDPGVYGPPVHANAPNGPVALALADFNRDGKPDLAVANRPSGAFTVLLNRCPSPDLTIAKTHAGTFTAGQNGTYTITVTNTGGNPTSGEVTVVDDLPAGLSASALSGSGWTCTLSPLVCKRSDALNAGASYPPITLTVRVASGAETNVTNTVTVAGGGELNALNNKATDPTAIASVIDLIIIKSHSGNFAQGAAGRTYTIIVKNAGRLATSAPVTVTDILPSGLTAIGLEGAGWSCSVGSLSCTRSDVLAGGANYPPITVTVNVSPSAPFSVTNIATVGGGNDSNAANNAAADPTVIWSSQTCASFASPKFYGTAFSANSVAMADFNHDGRTDAATANYSSHSVSILLGASDGSFGTPTHLNAPNFPRRITTGDLNNDGHADLVVAVEYNTAQLLVFLGNGNGTFAAPVSYAVGNYYYLNAFVLADLDRDGALDIVAANNTVNIYILRGNGNGTFGTPVAYTLNDSSYTVAVADFDGNGTADLAIGSYARISLLRGNGDGTFQPALQTGLTYSANEIAIGDFNRDGLPDLALAVYYEGIVILTGRGDGTFNPRVTVDVDWGYSVITVADINADGNDDLVAVNGSSSFIGTMIGNGDGTFQQVSHYSGGSPGQIVVGDFNGDGKADLAHADYYAGSLAVRLGGCPDLTITKSHSGNFRAGQTGASYTLTVRNVGGGGSRGTVTVKDQLPAGLTATSISSSSYWDWNCTLETLTCTRTEPIPTNETVTITVVVNVSNTAPTSVTNVATVSGGADSNPANNSASDPTTIVYAADLTVTKTHTGTFVPGQPGVYTITVGNIGSGSTSGLVTVVDSLPAPLTAASMSGNGWNCTLGTRTCTRSDSLGPTATYPPITLTVNVGDSFNTTVFNFVSVSGGGEAVTSNNHASDETRIMVAPGSLVATALSASQASVTWNALPDVTSYEVWRRTGAGTYALVGTTVSSLFLDNSLAANTTYLYRVRAMAGTLAGPMSQPDLTTTFIFADDPVPPRSVRVKALHIQQLRTAANILRAAAGLPPAVFTDASVAAKSRIKSVHLTQLRTAINEARAALGFQPVPFITPTLAGARIRAVNITELRGAVK
jgi:uncharacterized repeat protein (TIGR01451 family)